MDEQSSAWKRKSICSSYRWASIMFTVIDWVDLSGCLLALCYLGLEADSKFTVISVLIWSKCFASPVFVVVHITVLTGRIRCTSGTLSR